MVMAVCVARTHGRRLRARNPVRVQWTANEHNCYSLTDRTYVWPNGNDVLKRPPISHLPPHRPHNAGVASIKGSRSLLQFLSSILETHLRLCKLISSYEEEYQLHRHRHTYTHKHIPSAQHYCTRVGLSCRGFVKQFNVEDPNAHNLNHQSEES